MNRCHSLREWPMPRQGFSLSNSAESTSTSARCSTIWLKHFQPFPHPSPPLLQPTPSCQTASGKRPPIRSLANSIPHSLSEALLLAEFPRTGRLTSELLMTGSWMLNLEVFPHFYALATEDWYRFPNFPKLYTGDDWKCFINTNLALWRNSCFNPGFLSSVEYKSECILYQGSQNFKIPGSPSGRYSSDFGSPKINLTSPKKKKDLIYIYIYI